MVAGSAGRASPYAGSVASLRISACQVNTVVGDLDGNVGRIVSALAEAEAAGTDLAVFPELAITGYPPEDLLLKPTFVADNIAALDEVAAARRDCAAVVGFVEATPEGLFNAAAVCADGRVRGTYRKQRLPNYAVFDERRYFQPRRADPPLFEIAGVNVGVSICEDAWVSDGPVQELARGGAQVVVNLNASPFHMGKVEERQAMLTARAAEAGCPVVYVNLVGGQDELVFDGASMVVDASRRVLAQAGEFAEEILTVDVDVAGERPDTSLDVVVAATTGRSVDRDRAVGDITPLLGHPRAAYEALVLGTRDYVRKNGFGEVVVGLSGGVDSALVAAVAVDALGPEAVHVVLMPSRYSSDHSLADAEKLAANLGIDHRTVEIEPAHEAFTGMLADSFVATEVGIAEENLQPRIRGTLLMALSNKFGWLVLTTGNKSELAVGYATLYGDMAGGYAVIKDAPKLLVYDLCADRNARAGFDLIPENILTKPPSAELRPDQVDTDSLPPYEVLDPIVEAYIERDSTAGDLVKAGFDEELVRRVVRLVDVNEYKRRQAPPGPRITTKAFGKDRRLPITNGYRG